LWHIHNARSLCDKVTPQRITTQAFCPQLPLHVKRRLHLHLRLLVQNVGVRSKRLKEVQCNGHLKSGGVAVRKHHFQRGKKLRWSRCCAA